MMRIAMFYYGEVDTNAHGKSDLQVMRALADEHDITVFAARFDNPRPDRITSVHVPLPRLPLFAVLVVFWVTAPLTYLWHRVRHRVGFDLVHFHEVDLPFGDVCYVQFCNRAFLREVGVPRPWRGARPLARWLEHRLRAAVEPLVFARVGRIVVPSQGLAEELAEHFGPDVAAKVTVIPNFVPVDELARPADHDRAAARAELGLAPDDLVAVFTALGHYERKGLPLLLDAVAAVRRPELKLVVCGGTRAAIRTVREEAARRGIDDRVVVLETRDDIRPVLWLSDVFAFPSAYETFSLVAYEAAAAGLPLLVTPVHGVVDIVEDGVNGWVVGRDVHDIAKALRRIVEHRDELDRMGRAARASVQSFSPDAFSTRWRAFHRSERRSTMRSDRLLELVRGPSVLDVGCTDHVVRLGRPEWLHGRLRDRFDDVVGIDISRENIAQMRAAGFDEIHEQSAEDFELDRRFDTIVAGELIEHLANPGRFLERARAHLEPGGRIVLSTPYPFSLLYLGYAIAKYPRTCQNPEHVMWFCRRTIEALAERCGLRIEHFELVEDVDPNDPSRSYRMAVRANRVLRPVLPERLTRNTMLMTFVPA